MKNHPLRGHILRQIRKVDASQTAQMMTFSAYGRSYRVTMKRIASAQALHIYQAKFEDITEELQYDDKVRQTDDIMRNLCRMYQNVFFLDMQEDICDVLVGMPARKSTRRTGPASWLLPMSDDA